MTTVIDSRQASPYGALMAQHLVGAAEVATMLGVSRQHVSTLAKGKGVGFPEPEAELAAGRIWRREAIETWMSENPGHVADRRPVCGFCGKGEQHVAKLVHGPELVDEQGHRTGWMAICNECIALAADIVAEELAIP